jgi:cytochrome c-type biogenesis protein CcmH
VPAAADALDNEALQIARLLRCPICQSVSVAESPSELAQQMRYVIRQQLEQGQTRQDILAYFAERYGDSVLLDPPKRGFPLFVWLVPPAVILAGAVVVWRVSRRGSVGAGSVLTGPVAAPAVDQGLERYRARLRAELGERSQ